MHPTRHLLGCAALGVLLFGAEQWTVPAAPLSIDAAFTGAARDEALLAREARRLGLDRDDAFVRETLASRVDFDGAPADDRFAEAVARGIDARDPVVRRRLASLLAARIRADAAAVPVEERDLRAWFEARRERWRTPATVDIAQVFFAGAGAFDRAAAARVAIERDALAPAAAARLGDPAFFGATIPRAGEAQLAARFGAAFARAALASPAGAWSGPIASSHGVHLIWVRERSAARDARLEEVRGAVEAAERTERAERTFAAALAKLRAQAPSPAG